MKGTDKEREYKEKGVTTKNMSRKEREKTKEWEERLRNREGRKGRGNHD